MLIALYMVLLVGGMWILGVSFNFPDFGGVLFAAGVLIICAAVALPVTLSRHENRDSNPGNW
ncbi:hypothetical protein [Microbacterium kunmingense]|jgi:hypothetical protein|uniref:hypothetical protein n=1 Tax=Microbacterium kunmingense TaxID=2915939 RepID=UPI0020043A77|nr:hypothetical protein [Microbacterium kunmingense]